MKPKQLGGYELNDVLGEGGMGTVYRAHDPTLDRPAAVKVIRTQSLSKEGRQRFLREARACSKINHPNIITVYAAGEENDTPYMAMEFLEGRTLREVLVDGPIDWRSATRWMIDILGALDRLHGEGIVHRDLKPENIMITGDGVVKLMDFGLAHLDAQTALTQEGMTLGTVPYMSPEQVLGKAADSRSDLFSLATIFHEMITGQHPFRGEHPMAVMYSIRNETPKPIKLHSQDYPVGLQAVLDHAFEKELDKRYESAEGFRTELLTLLPEGSGEFPAANGGGKGVNKTVVGIIAAVAVVVIALLAWQASVNRGPVTDRELAKNLNEAGDALDDTGNYAAAEVKYREAIAADPTYAVPWSNMGSLAIKTGDPVEAEDLFLKAVDLDPKFAVALANLGDIYYVRGDLEKAHNYLNDAIAADSSEAAIYNNLAALHLERGKPADAASVLDLGLARNANEVVRSAMLVKRARAAVALGDRPAAKRYVEGVTATTEDDATFVRELLAE